MRIPVAAFLAATACAAVALADPPAAPAPPQGDATGSGSGTGAGSAAAAPAPVKDPKVARKWLEAAEQLVARGEYDLRHKRDADAKEQLTNAVTAYQNAIAASDDVTLYVGLATAEDKLGEKAAAYRDLARVVDPKAGARPDAVKKAQARLDDLSTQIGLVVLEVTPDGAAVLLDGKQVAVTPMTSPLVLDPGAYTLSFEAVGYQPKDTDLKIEAGSEADLKIALEPVKIEVAQQHVVAAVAPPPPKPPDRLPLYIGVGATGGFVAIATVTGIAALVKHGTFTNPARSPSARKDAQSSGRTLAHITDVCLVGAVLSAGFTAYWYRYRYAPEQKARAEHAKLDVVPWVQPGSGGLTAVGMF